MQSAKQTAANVAASAKAGMEKTKATMQEKAEKMTTRDPVQKEMATEKKQERFHEAEREKHEARGTHAPTGGTFGHTTGGDYPVGGGQHAVGGGGYGGDVPQEYPQGMGGQMDYPEGGMGLGSGGVGSTDPNVGGGARTGYGSGGTI